MLAPAQDIEQPQTGTAQGGVSTRVGRVALRRRLRYTLLTL